MRRVAIAKRFCRIANKLDIGKIAEILSKDGQLLLPFLGSICNTEQTLDELIDVVCKHRTEHYRGLSEGFLWHSTCQNDTINRMW